MLVCNQADGKNEVHGEAVPMQLYPPQTSDYLESNYGLHSQRPETNHLSQGISCMPYHVQQIKTNYGQMKRPTILLNTVWQVHMTNLSSLK